VPIGRPFYEAMETTLQYLPVHTVQLRFVERVTGSRC